MMMKKGSMNNIFPHDISTRITAWAVTIATMVALLMIWAAPSIALAQDPSSVADPNGTQLAGTSADQTANTPVSPIEYKTKTVTKTYGAKFTNKLTVNTDGAIKYTSSNPKIATVDSKGKVTTKGVGTVTIKAASSKTAAYPASSVTYKLIVNPRAVVLKSLKAVSGGFRATWAKGNKADANGYQIRYSRYRDLSSARTMKISKLATTSAKLKKFSGPANCFAQVRAYAKGKDGKTYYSAWSKSKIVIGTLNSGDKTLDGYVKALIKRFGTGDGALKKAFDYVTGLKYKSSATSPKGNWTISYAKNIYKNKAGNCYEKAALLDWVARGLGYNANAVAGKLVNISSKGKITKNPHGWVEIKQNGKVSICDPDTTKTFKDAGIKEVRGYSTYLFMVDNEKPYTYQK